MVKKKDDSFHMCIDFCMLNDNTVADAFPLPRIDETINNLGSARYFTAIDLGCAFWQIILKVADRYKTAFATKTGLYH